MLGHIFYFFGLFLFIFSLSRTISYFKFIDIKEWVIKFKKVTEKVPEKSDFKNEIDYGFYNAFGCVGATEALWFICGLVSNSWVIFLSLLIIGFVLKPINNNIPFVLQKFIGFSFNLLKTGIILLLVINHFHLHIDWIKWMSSHLV